jgi:CRISPR-associated endonuclease/helicase Cas3
MLTEDEALQVARDAFAARKKVLWVVNRVSRCQEVARRLAGDLGQQLGDAVLCYHSRYRLIDRKERHDAAIAGLGIGQSGPIILVSTQVCEMSLDLDADVLITEIASVPALIQRMGRCCREPIPADGRVGEVYFYLPATPRPYARNDIADGERFGQYLAEQDTLAHADLAAYLERTAPRHEFAVGGFTGFIDSGWYAMARDDSFREDDDYSCDAVLDCDVPAYLRERDHHSGRAAGYIVPVPRRLGSPDSRLGAFVRLASAAHYDPDLGFVEPEAERGG